MFVVHSNRIVVDDKIIAGYLCIDNGVIVDIKDESANLAVDVEAGNNRIIPGIIDTHNHGCLGYRMHEGISEEEIRHYLKGNASFGVTTVFPTFGSLHDYKSYPTAVKLMGELVDGAQIGGIHSEGPFGARVGEKGINTGYPSVDMDIAKKMVEYGQGQLKLVGIAPEVEGALDAVKYWTGEGVTVAAYHTNANFAQANAGIDAGITVMTHLGNVMTGLHHRDVGTLGAGLLRDEAWCEIICDGLHISLPMVEIMLKVKDHDKVMMISDNVQYAGLPMGHYTTSQSNNLNSDRKVINITEEGFVLSTTGRLSGSSKPVLYGIGNLVEKLGMDLTEVCRLSSLNPARKYNLTGKGMIKVGNDADFVIISDDYKALETYCKGVKVYDHTVDTDLVNHVYLEQYKID